MVLQLLIFVACAAIGVQLQRRHPRADLLRARLWSANLVLLIPLAATYALLSLRMDRTVLEVIGVGVGAWWCTVALAGAWARVATTTRSQRGATWLVGAFPNTGFIGFPLANLAYGHDGLRTAVLYDQVSLVVPAVVVGVVIAARHADRSEDVEADGSSVLRDALLSPPTVTVAVLLFLRVTVLPDPIDVDWLGSAVGAAVGPVGFLLLGLSLPLDEVSHERREVVATMGAVAIRIVAAPLLVLAVARVVDVEVPSALVLVAAMPTAFHALIVARVSGLDPGVLRLGIAASSVLVIGASVAIAA